MLSTPGKVQKNEAMGFVEAVMADLGGPRSSLLLERLDAATPWEELAAPIRALPEYNNPGAGHPPWCPVLMLKGLMLQKWNNLSDPGLEEALKDRISFRKFVGLSFTDKTPDETTIVKFRARLRDAGLHDAIFDAVVRHIESKGLLVKRGTMVDATIIEAPRGRPRPGGTTTRDQEASFTARHGVPHHGYKGHIAADLSGIVTDYRLGTARRAAAGRTAGPRRAPHRDDEAVTGVQTGEIPGTRQERLRLCDDPRRVQHQEEPRPRGRLNPGHAATDRTPQVAIDHAPQLATDRRPPPRPSHPPPLCHAAARTKVRGSNNDFIAFVNFFFAGCDGVGFCQGTMPTCFPEGSGLRFAGYDPGDEGGQNRVDGPSGPYAARRAGLQSRTDSLPDGLARDTLIDRLNSLPSPGSDR
ncbi:MAG: IS5 family transposase [Phycisphaerales bacterium]|nr:IS5 family transposase [Phycisphaerales bacterium]